MSSEHDDIASRFHFTRDLVAGSIYRKYEKAIRGVWNAKELDYAQDAADKLGPAGWTAPPAWSPDGQAVVVTNLVKTETDANGVTRAQTNLVVYAAGQQGATLIEGARNIAWSPASS